ncbi:YaaC family protein [Streptomyces sp. H39-S7]|uniref:YaaC family protein n=1 Tax=Streptomyces sp. H39-S7 TaxID=3004357 RepID=UPI0022AE8AD0|nr:YaaC family protein [Streptomyces sp. H39-S7]MCZ4124976.1 YaaC family protein [Streptomyces sp. H39-S7]
MRADPPGAAGKNSARKETFCAALEQAEQLFTAAKVTDAMVRPLLVYYGLNQAGRAIAAAASSVPDRDQQPGARAEPWKLTGHGLKIVGRSAAMNGPDVASLVLVDEGSGAFPHLAEILGSGSLPARTPDSAAEPVTVGQLWATLSDTVEFDLPGPVGLPVLAFDADGPPVHGQEWARLHGIPARIFEEQDQQSALRDFLNCYPTLGAFGIPAFDRRVDWAALLGMPAVRIFWNAEAPVAGQLTKSLEARVATRYRGQHFVYPALGDSAKPLHPFLAWWAVLYALSMLARYEPCAWQKRTNIDTSKEAAAIEHLLDAALEFLPRVIMDTIDEVTQ